MASREADAGITGGTVAANITRLRGDMSYTQLSRRLEERASWSINAVGIRRIESCERRVTVDDLVAFALALDVSPITLLMPKTDAGDESVAVTGVSGPVTAGRLWNWMVGRLPLADDTAERALSFIVQAVPGWLVRKGEVVVVESGAGPNLRQCVRWSGGEHPLDAGIDGHD